MSLINQMLRDLERQRKSGRPGQDPAWPAVSTHPGSGKNRRVGLIAAIVAVLVLGGVAAWYFFPQAPRTDSPTPTKPQVARTAVPLPSPPHMPDLPTTAQTLPPTPAAPAVPVQQAQIAPASSLSKPEEQAETVPSAQPIAEASASPAEPLREHVAAPPTPAPEESVQPPAKADPVAEPPRKTTDTPMAVPPSPRSSARITKAAPPLTPSEQADRLYQAGLNAVNQGRIPKAETDFREALVKLPEHHPSRERLTALLLASNRVIEADRLLAEGLVLDPDHIPFRQAYARLLADRGEIEKARSILEASPAPDLAGAPDYYALLAALQQRLGQSREAAALYGKLVTFNPRVGAWWFGLAASLEQAGATAEAVRAYQAALQRPDLAPALKNYASGRIERLSHSPRPSSDSR